VCVCACGRLCGMAAGLGSVVAGWPCGLLIEHIGWMAYFVALGIVACVTLALVYPYRYTSSDDAVAKASPSPTTTTTIKAPRTPEPSQQAAGTLQSNAG